MKIVNYIRYVYAATRILFSRTVRSEEETMQAINDVRRKYGLKEWEASE